MSTPTRTLAATNPLPRPKWLPTEVWPFDTRAITVDGTQIAVTDVGEGPTLLFVHTGMWSFVWRDLIARLAGSFRCVALDAPGTGRSGRPGARSTTLEASTRAIEAVIDQLALDEITLVIHDLGGPAGLAAAARKHDRIRAIVAINAFGWRPSGAALRGMLALMGSGPMRELDVRCGSPLLRLTATSFGVGRHLDRPSRRAFRAGVDHAALRSFHRYLRDARGADGVLADVERATSTLLADRPLLTVFGERNDPFGFQARWKELFPHAQQVVVRKGHHFPMCDAPDLVADAIRTWHHAL